MIEHDSRWLPLPSFKGKSENQQQSEDDKAAKSGHSRSTSRRRISRFAVLDLHSKIVAPLSFAGVWRLLCEDGNNYPLLLKLGDRPARITFSQRVICPPPNGHR